MSKRRESLFRREYNKMIAELQIQLIEYRDALIETMQDTTLKTFKTDQDFIGMAKRGILHKMETFADEEKALLVTQEIVNTPTDDE